MAEAVLQGIASVIILLSRLPILRRRSRTASVPASGKAHILGGGAQMDVSTDDMGPSESNS